jgi:rare lipoprotein A (peptidoglycan hydrolase)
VQLGSCLALVLVPLLLLATPHRATLHGIRHHTGAASRRGDAGLTRLSTSWTIPVDFAAPATASAPAPSDDAVSHTGFVDASFRQVMPTTTTTSPAPGSTARAVTPAPATVAAVESSPEAPTPRPSPLPTSTGLATWYGSPPGTCASPTLDFGTVVTVTDISTGKAVRCLVDDREAHNPGRVIDLSPATFSQLASPPIGVIEVRLTW